MLTAITKGVETLLQPISTVEGLRWGLLDYYGALRLSQIVIWSATGGFGGKITEERRLLQELFGLMVVVLGPETFLGMSITGLG